MKELITLRDRETKLESQLIGNALLMAKSGLINQRSVGLQRATALLAAKRSSRNKAMEADDQRPYDLPAELATAIAATPPITDADRREMQAASRFGQKSCFEEAGKVMTLDDDTEPVEIFDHTEMDPKARNAIWKNKDSDLPVVIVGIMRSPGLPDHYMASFLNRPVTLILEFSRLQLQVF